MVEGNVRPEHTNALEAYIRSEQLGRCAASKTDWARNLEDTT